MLIVVLVSVEVTYASLFSGHHHVETATVITVIMRHTTKDGHFVHYSRTLWNNVGNLYAWNIRAYFMKVASDF